MKELVVISGKGGTGKTSIVASFAALATDQVIADCDVDAADLHLILDPNVEVREPFIGGKRARNRIVYQSMESNDADEGGRPSERTFSRYRRLAEGLRQELHAGCVGSALHRGSRYGDSQGIAVEASDPLLSGAGRDVDPEAHSGGVAVDSKLVGSRVQTPPLDSFCRLRAAGVRAR